MIAGLHAAIGTLAALEHRAATGEGQHVDLSQVEAVASHIGASVMERAAEPRGNRHPTTAPHGVFPCAGDDRWIAIASESDDTWHALCAAMGQPALARDARFATAALRKEHEDALDALVGAWTREHDAHAVMATLQARGVAAGVVQDARDLVERDAHLRARGYWQRVEHPVVGAFDHEGVIARLSDTPGRVWHAAPTLGQHTRAVLTKLLGLGDDEIARYAKEGVLE
jgi:crotonobetainyl-CoA:carnitine CoA-transferase CaiB-like acyl-CoA transferase